MIEGSSTEDEPRPASGPSPHVASTRGRADAREQQHRTRNMLAVLRSVFTRTVETGGSLDEVAAHFQGRFDTIAPFLLDHSGDDRGAYDLETLVWDELQRYPVSTEEEAEVSGPPERLPHHLAQPVALALHELVTNAVKFGALDAPGQGKLAITWWRDNGDLVLRWRETGVPIVRDAPSQRGFGREFIEYGLPYQIGAQTSFAIEPGGVESIIRVPGAARGGTRAQTATG